MSCKVSDISSKKLIKALKMYYLLYFLTIFTFFTESLFFIYTLEIFFAEYKTVTQIFFPHNFIFRKFFRCSLK